MASTKSLPRASAFSGVVLNCASSFSVFSRRRECRTISSQGSKRACVSRFGRPGESHPPVPTLFPASLYTFLFPLAYPFAACGKCHAETVSQFGSCTFSGDPESFGFLVAFLIAFLIPLHGVLMTIECFEVFNVATGTVSTQVMHFKIIRDFAMMLLPYMDMVHSVSAIHVFPEIAILIQFV